MNRFISLAFFVLTLTTLASLAAGGGGPKNKTRYVDISCENKVPIKQKTLIVKGIGNYKSGDVEFSESGPSYKLDMTLDITLAQADGSGDIYANVRIPDGTLATGPNGVRNVSGEVQDKKGTVGWLNLKPVYGGSFSLKQVGKKDLVFTVNDCKIEQR